MGQRWRSATSVLVLAVAVSASACGARVTDQQIAAAGGGVASAPLTGQAGVADPGAVDDPSTAGSSGRGGGAGAVGGGDHESAGSDRAAGPAAAAGASRGDAAVERTASDVGITPETIVLGHVTQLSGPVPGLFEGSVSGIRAVAAYLNSRGGLAGREVKVDIRDDQFDATANRNATRDLIAKTFALAGGISLYDDASAADVQESGIPDVTTAISHTRAQIPNNFAYSPNVDGAPTGQFLYFKERYPEAVGAVGSLYGDVPSAKRVHENYRAAGESVGYVWKYDRGYQPTETDYTADIIRMRQLGVRAVFLMSVDAKNVARILKAAAQQNWEPDVWMLGASSYDRTLPVLAGPAADGIQVFLATALFQGEDAAIVPEVKLFNDWVARVRPGWTPDTYAAGAWMAGRLLEQAMREVGPNPTRREVVDALRSITSFTANGMLAETGPGVKRPATCYLIAELREGAYRRVEPQQGFRCDGSFFRRG